MTCYATAENLAAECAEWLKYIAPFNTHKMELNRAKSALLVVDMPFGSFQVSPERAVSHAVQLVKQGRAEAVKLEGGADRLSAARAILAADIPVMGHIGLTPQSVHALGGYRVQGRTLAGIDRLQQDALQLEEAGCFALVLEGIPHPVARLITRSLRIPTIGIGSGPGCDGQILVLHDMLGLNPEHPYKFVRVYADGAGVLGDAIRRYAGDVRAGQFPTLAESFELDPTILADMEHHYGTDHQDQ